MVLLLRDIFSGHSQKFGMEYKELSEILGFQNLKLLLS